MLQALCTHVMVQWSWVVCISHNCFTDFIQCHYWCVWIPSCYTVSWEILPKQTHHLVILNQHQYILVLAVLKNTLTHLGICIRLQGQRKEWLHYYVCIIPWNIPQQSAPAPHIILLCKKLKPTKSCYISLITLANTGDTLLVVSLSPTTTQTIVRRWFTHNHTSSHHM